MHWQSIWVTMESCGQQTRNTPASQSPRWHWPSLITPLPEVQKELAAHDHQPAVFTTLSSKLKESEASTEVKGSREENMLYVNLEDSTTGLSAYSNPRAMGRSQNHNTQELGGLLEKFSGESSAKTELCLRHCRAETPSIHPSYHVACLFYSRDATGQWHRMALQNNFSNFPSGPKTTSMRCSLERPVSAGSKGSKVWPFLPRHNIGHTKSPVMLYFIFWNMEAYFKYS